MSLFSFILLTVSENKNFEYFFRKFTLYVAPSSNKIKLFWTKSRMQHGGLLNKQICEKKSNISSETAETVNFLFSYYKSMGTISCHSNQSSYLTGIKNTTFVEANVLSMYAKNSASLHFCKKKIPNIPNEPEKIVNFLFSH